MAEKAEYYLGLMIPDLQDLEQKGLFTKEEIKHIVKKLTKFEYALNRRIAQKADFLRYIEYEMNLDELRLKRRARLVTDRTARPTRSDWAGPNRISNLYKRATIKFPGDPALWLSWIRHARRQKRTRELSEVYASAIQKHPNKPTFWILGAKWEFEENGNIGAARVLLQRALRLNPQSQELWGEYFRLELVYVEKIKARRRIFGIDGASMDEQQKKLEAQADDMENANGMIVLPSLTGEDVSDKSTVMEEAMAERLKEENNPILQGDLVKIVYRHAVSAIPTDLDFRTQFLSILSDFTDTISIQNEIYESIRSDFALNPKALSLYASRFLYIDDKDHPAPNVNSPTYVTALQNCVKVYTQLCDSCEDELASGLWEEYTRFLWAELMRVKERNLELYLIKSLHRAYKAAKKANALNAAMMAGWVRLCVEKDEDESEGQRVLEKAMVQFPKDESLWKMRLGLAMGTWGKDEQVSIERVQVLCDSALKALPENLPIWTLYMDWIRREAMDKRLDNDDVQKVFQTAVRNVTALLPSVGEPGLHRNMVKRLVLTRYIEWALSESGEGISKARQVYDQLFVGAYPDVQVVMYCLEVEQGAEDSKEKERRLKALWDRALQLDPKTGTTHLAYIKFLLQKSKFEEANAIYYRATKSVADIEAFEKAYHSLQEELQGR